MPTGQCDPFREARERRRAIHGSVTTFRSGATVPSLEQAKGATTDEIEGVRHDRIHPVFVEMQLDDGALRRRQVDGLGTPVPIVRSPQFDALPSSTTTAGGSASPTASLNMTTWKRSWHRDR